MDNPTHSSVGARPDRTMSTHWSGGTLSAAQRRVLQDSANAKRRRRDREEARNEG